jgi:2-C-methyl-D-erythritol 4-phosphate cytidylyltransferase
MRSALVIPAAGSGSRFGAALPKQLLALAGRAVLLRSLDAFAGLVDEAVLVVSADIRGAVESLLVDQTFPFPVRLVEGGTTRQESVYNGIRATDPTCHAVLIHDAVRPLVPRSCIAACLEALRYEPGAVVAVPCAPTVKRAAADTGVVDTTVPREGLWLAQTPQGGRRPLLIEAFARAAANGWSCSDDAQVMERAGFRVALVQGDACNLKITTPDDWAVAEALIAARAIKGGGHG